MERYWTRVAVVLAAVAVALLWTSLPTSAVERPGGGMAGADDQSMTTGKSGHETGTSGDRIMDLESTGELGKGSETPMRNPEFAAPARKGPERSSAFESTWGFQRIDRDHDYLISPY